MRMIDADALKTHVYDKIINSDYVCRMIDAQPTIEPKRGRWIETDYYAYDDTYRCSVCGNEWEFIVGTPKDNGANYCPNCGAKMDGVEE